MKEACGQVGMTYETLRFYCNEGLVPNIKRDKNNYRVFDERNIEWLKSLQCLRKCGISVKGMKEYLDMCLEGPASIVARKSFLAAQRALLLNKVAELNESIDYIDSKTKFFDGILAGNIEYTSNLVRISD